MRTRAMTRVSARHNWDRLRVSFWFAPALLAVIGVLFAWTMISLDNLIPNEVLNNSRFILSGTVGEMRNGLLGIAATVLTTAGVVFTLLTLPLSTVASQYGSRLLRVFLADRTTQIVLGMFTGTFVYCVAAALSILPVELEPDAPQLTATFGLVFMMAAFAMLILLVQHISTMLQAPNIAAAAGVQLLDVVRESPDVVRTDDDPGLPGQDVQTTMVEADSSPIFSRRTGYVQALDPEIVVTVAREADLVVRLVCRPGAFVRPGEVIARVWPAGHIDSRRAQQIERAFRLGNQRTPTQDVVCAINQLVEMAVRAMSPAINDPLTALTCLDHLVNGLILFIQQGGENLNTYDRNGQLRLIFEPVSLDELLGAAFDMLRHASCDNATVLQHMLKAIDEMGAEAKSAAARRLLLHHVALIQAESRQGDLIEDDRQRIQRSAEFLESKLGAAHESV